MTDSPNPPAGREETSPEQPAQNAAPPPSIDESSAASAHESGAKPDAHRSGWTSRLIVVPFIVLGVLAIVFAGRRRDEPPSSTATATPPTVRVLDIVNRSIRPTAIGYGTANPVESWQAITQVGGRVVEVAPDLRNGTFVAEGTLLVRIDPTDYELRIAQQEASIAQAEAAIDQLAVEEQNSAALLEIEDRKLKLLETEFERNASLYEDGSISQTAFETSERELLAQRSSVQTMKNTLALIPTRRRTNEAQAASARAGLAEARQNLDRTRLVAPFDGRLANVDVELGTYAAAGRALFELDSMAATEVLARVSPEDMRNVVASIAPHIDPTERINDAFKDFAGSITATVRVPSAAGDAPPWVGTVTRIADSVDPVTRTAGVVVEVKDPYRRDDSIIRPPLVKGLFCEVTLTGAPLQPVYAVPRDALSEGRVWVLNASNQIRAVAAEPEFVQGDLAIYPAMPSPAGTQPPFMAGDRVVLTSMPFAVEGSTVSPVSDDDTRNVIDALAPVAGSGAAQ